MVDEFTGVYRHEVKYYISRYDACQLAKALANHMKPDENANGNGEYWVRSLYFDTMDNSSFSEKINGCTDRKKIRLRTYDTNSETVKLELKLKNGSYYKKESIAISRMDSVKLFNGASRYLLRFNDKTAAKCFAYMHYEAYRPSILIDYEREAFFCPYENIRITIDKSIRTSICVKDMFAPDIPMVPVFDDERYVLEVKFSTVLPGFIKSIISGVNPAYTSASKYCLARMAVHY